MKVVLIAAIVLMTAGPSQGGEPREEEYLQQGNGHLAAGRYAKAVNAYEQAARLKPDSAAALLGMGTSYLKLGDNGVSVDLELLAKAAAALKRALEVDPDLATARYQLGMTSLAQDDREEAIRQCELLKPLDKDLAHILSERIGAYKPPKRYRESGSSGTRQGSTSRTGGSGGATMPGTSFTGTVDLYGADWCPHSRAAVQYMTSKEISFAYHKIEEDMVAKNEYQRLGGGGIPLIAINGMKIMNGFNAESLERHLRNNR